MDVARVLIAAVGCLISAAFSVFLPLFLAFGMNDGTSASAEWVCYVAFLTSVPAFVLGLWKPIPAALWLLCIGILWTTWMIFELLKIHPFALGIIFAPYFWPTYLTISGGLGYLLVERYARSEAIEQQV
jgi:hypothetical protein